MAIQLLRLVCALLFTFTSCLGFAQDALGPIPETNSRVVSQWTRALQIPPEALSVWVQEIGGNQPSLSLNAQTPQNPASLMKLLTTYAALEILGPALQWRTQVFTNAPLQKDVLMGDLIIKGGGDPKLVLQNVWLLLRQLRLQGIREIRGDILLDRSLFNIPPVDPANFDGQALRPYNVPPEALLFNFKATGFFFKLDPETDRYSVYADPKPLNLKVDANISASTGPCEQWSSRLKISFDEQARPPQAAFHGSIPKSCGDQELYRALFTSEQYAAGLLKQLWEESGGVWSGIVREGKTPANARLLSEWLSDPLAEIVRAVNKNSNNVMAQMLFLSLGLGSRNLQAKQITEIANLEKSRAAVQEWLAAKQFTFPELVLENGSGLSRKERISAYSLGRLLVSAYSSPIMPEYLSSLPLVGIDGTLKSRLKNSPLAGFAHIKTGTLRDVRGIAGYVLAASGRRYAVVSIINGSSVEKAAILHNQLLSWVYEKG